MKYIRNFILPFFLLVAIFLVTPAHAKTLSDRVNEAFRQVFSRNPSATENKYWLGRIGPDDKNTYQGLVDGMAYYKSLGKTMPGDTVTLASRVNQAFRQVFRRNPTATENTYWAVRVLNGDKTTYDGLVGAMLYAKATGKTVGGDPTMSADTPEALKAAVRPMFYSFFGSKPSSSENDWWQRRIDCEEILTNRGLRGSMHFHYVKNARIGSPDICKYALTPLPTAPEEDSEEDDGTEPVETF